MNTGDLYELKERVVDLVSYKLQRYLIHFGFNLFCKGEWISISTIQNFVFFINQVDSFHLRSTTYKICCNNVWISYAFPINILSEENHIFTFFFDQLLADSRDLYRPPVYGFPSVLVLPLYNICFISLFYILYKISGTEHFVTSHLN